MSQLFVWCCEPDVESHTEEEQQYYPNYDHIDSYVVVSATIEGALYSHATRSKLVDLTYLNTGRELLCEIDEYALPLTEAEHASYGKPDDALYCIRWNWVAECVAEYHGDKYVEGDVLVRSYNAA